jgi:curved DNA-binding protein CbpA
MLPFAHSRAYHQKVLIVHPDKGGSEEIFRLVNSAFEVLRNLFEKKSVNSFYANKEKATAEEFASAESQQGSSFQSWDFYHDAAEEDVPAYQVR